MYYSLVPNKTKRTHWGCKLNYFEVENALLRWPERTSIGRGTNQKPPQWDFSTNGWWFTPELPATTVATVLTYLETSSVLLSVLDWFSRAWVLSGRCEVILQPGWAAAGTELWLSAVSVLLEGCSGKPEEQWPLGVAPTRRAGSVAAVPLIFSCVNNFSHLYFPSAAPSSLQRLLGAGQRDLGAAPGDAVSSSLQDAPACLPITSAQHLILVAFLRQGRPEGCSQTNSSQNENQNELRPAAKQGRANTRVTQ